MPPSPGSSSPERTGARPSPVLRGCSSRSQSPSPAWDAMAPCSGRVGLLICIWGQIALLGDGEPPAESERAGTEVLPAKEGGSRCRRSGRRRIRRQARRARRGSRSRRPRAGSSRGLASPSAAASSVASAEKPDRVGKRSANRAPATEHREGVWGGKTRFASRETAELQTEPEELGPSPTRSSSG